MISGVSPRSARYGWVRSSFSRRNPNGLFDASIRGSGVAGFDGDFCFERLSPRGDSPASLAACLELVLMASASRPNQSIALSAAAWMVAFSILAMKSRELPPPLHSLKQFQRFLLTLTRNWVGLLPLWMGQGPLKLSPL